VVSGDIQFVRQFCPESILMFFQVTTFVFGVISIEIWDSQFPVWAFVLSLIVCAFIYLVILFGC
jgi:hypothetical protein